MSDTTIRITDNSDLVGEEFEQACERALTRIGLQAETYAKRECPVDTGNLRNNITNAVDDKSAYVGTNVTEGKEDRRMALTRKLLKGMGLTDEMYF